ncbi:MAG TPA: hypothetical protein VMJ31_11815 [Methylocystis sp.]|nr:hypothetical protein [Methylocystis sp.]
MRDWFADFESRSVIFDATTVELRGFNSATGLHADYSFTSWLAAMLSVTPVYIGHKKRTGCSKPEVAATARRGPPP